MHGSIRIPQVFTSMDKLQDEIFEGFTGEVLLCCVSKVHVAGAMLSAGEGSFLSPPSSTTIDKIWPGSYHQHLQRLLPEEDADECQMSFLLHLALDF